MTIEQRKDYVRSRIRPRDSKALTMRAILRMYRAGEHQAATTIGYVRWGRSRGLAMSRDAWYAKRSRERRDARYSRLGAEMCTALGLIPRDTLAELHKIGVSDKAIASLRRYGPERRNRQVAAWLASPAWADTISRKLTSFAADMLEDYWPFRRSHGRWAGGEHNVTVKLGEPGCIGYTQKVWSGNGKWSGTDSYAELTVTPGALVHFPDLKTADGSVILDAELIAPREYRATWVVQSAGVNIRPQSGWIIRGYHSTVSTLEGARKAAAAARRKQYAVAIKARYAARDKRHQLAPLAGVYIDLADSLRAGNCRPVTMQFADEVWRKIGASGPCAVRADVVLSIRDDMYTRRALSAAQTR